MIAPPTAAAIGTISWGASRSSRAKSTGLRSGRGGRNRPAAEPHSKRRARSRSSMAGTRNQRWKKAANRDYEERFEWRADHRRRVTWRTPRELERGREVSRSRNTAIQRDASFLFRISGERRGKSLANEGTLFDMNNQLTESSGSSERTTPGARKLDAKRLADDILWAREIRM